MKIQDALEPLQVNHLKRVSRICHLGPCDDSAGPSQATWGPQ